MSDNPLSGRTRLARDRVALGFGNLHASPGDHIGHFYQTREEWGEVVIPYVRAGLEAGEKCVYLIPSEIERQVLLKALAAAGLHAERALATGQLVLDEGTHDPQALQDFLHRAISEIPEKYPFLRWGGDMTWSLKKLPTSESLMTWETHCNTADNPPAVFLCQYELKVFAGNVVMDALHTHPLCLVGNVIHRNPFYEKPDAFLHKLARRRATQPIR
ncbi:MAG: MEDS domain-containing protein [Nitrospiraceae bacterium]|nr:MEDS domain-containing protein [Nitrospiraceae bacterium]